MNNYTHPTIWNTIWSRPYHNYEKHHQIFWKMIRDESKGIIFDLGCGSASCWRDVEGKDVTGFDFSSEAIEQARKNYPKGKFYVADIENYIPFSDYSADTVVLCGVVNYYHDLSKLFTQVKRIIKPGSHILVTINVIDDFPDRHWDAPRILKEFSPLGYVRMEFVHKVGWFIHITAS